MFSKNVNEIASKKPVQLFKIQWNLADSDNPHGNAKNFSDFCN